MFVANCGLVVAAGEANSSIFLLTTLISLFLILCLSDAGVEQCASHFLPVVVASSSSVFCMSVHTYVVVYLLVVSMPRLLPTSIHHYSVLLNWYSDSVSQKQVCNICVLQSLLQVWVVQEVLLEGECSSSLSLKVLGA